MSDYSFTFNSGGFNPARAYTYSFLMLVNSSTFSFAVIEDTQLLLWGNNCPIGDLIAPKGLKDIFSAHYKQKLIGIASTGFILVPSVMFNPERIAELAIVLDVKATDKVLTCKLDDDNEVIYKATDTMISAISAHFDLNDVVFAAKGWINKIADKAAVNTLYLNVNPKTVELLSFRGDKLRFYNRFDTAGEDDLTYFALMVARELKMQPQQTNLVISGGINENDMGLRRLKEFFRSATLNSIQLLMAPQYVAPHQILSLAALTLCASSVEN